MGSLASIASPRGEFALREIVSQTTATTAKQTIAPTLNTAQSVIQNGLRKLGDNAIRLGAERLCTEAVSTSASWIPTLFSYVKPVAALALRFLSSRLMALPSMLIPGTLNENEDAVILPGTGTTQYFDVPGISAEIMVDPALYDEDDAIDAPGAKQAGGIIGDAPASQHAEKLKVIQQRTILENELEMLRHTHGDTIVALIKNALNDSDAELPPEMEEGDFASMQELSTDLLRMQEFLYLLLEMDLRDNNAQVSTFFRSKEGRDMYFYQYMMRTNPNLLLDTFSREQCIMLRFLQVTLALQDMTHMATNQGIQILKAISVDAKADQSTPETIRRAELAMWISDRAITTLQKVIRLLHQDTVLPDPAINYSILHSQHPLFEPLLVNLDELATSWVTARMILLGRSTQDPLQSLAEIQDQATEIIRFVEEIGLSETEEGQDVMSHIEGARQWALETQRKLLGHTRKQDPNDEWNN